MYLFGNPYTNLKPNSTLNVSVLYYYIYFSFSSFVFVSFFLFFRFSFFVIVFVFSSFHFVVFVVVVVLFHCLYLF